MSSFLTLSVITSGTGGYLGTGCSRHIVAERLALGVCTACSHTCGRLSTGRGCVYVTGGLSAGSTANDTVSKAIAVSLKGIGVAESIYSISFSIAAGITRLVDLTTCCTGSRTVLAGVEIVTECGVNNLLHKHNAAILTCAVGVCVMTVGGTSSLNRGLCMNKMSESGDSTSGTDSAAVTGVNSISVVGTGGKNLICKDVEYVLVLGVELVAAVSGIAECDVVDHKTAADSIGVTGEVNTLNTVAGGFERSCNGASIKAVYVIVKADGIGNVVKNDCNINVKPTGEHVLSSCDTGNVLLKENKTGRGAVVKSKDLNNLLGGCVAGFLIDNLNVGSGSKSEEVIDNVLFTPSTAFYEGHGEVLIHVSVYAEGNEAYGGVRGVEAGEAVSLHRKPELKLRSISLALVIQLGILCLDK